MREIVIISGKGGTGKTSLVGAFACLAGRSVLADCDVDAADLHLLLEPTPRETEPFDAGWLARIDPDLCTACGECLENCRYDAIIAPPAERPDDPYAVDRLHCEGCGVCGLVCPEDAVIFERPQAGELYLSDTRFGPMSHARLLPGAENSGKLVAAVRRRAKDLARNEGAELLIVDGPPGIGCPVISSVTGADGLMAVTEPTPSGLHDLGRVLDLAAHFGLPAAACINKADLNPEAAARIREECRRREIPVLGEIAYNTDFVRAQIEGKTIPEFSNGRLTEQVAAVFEALRKHFSF